MKEKRQAIKALKEAGYTETEEGGSHTLYINPELKVSIPLSRSSKFNAHNLQTILNEIKRYQKNQGQ